MVRVLRLFIFVIAALSVLTVAVPTEAQTTPTPAECIALIGTSENPESGLRSATLNTTFIGQNAAKDQAGLVGKLDSAVAKLEAGKFQDAIDALTGFSTKVEALGNQGKIAPENAAELIEGTNAAIACVEQLLEETPTA